MLLARYRSWDWRTLASELHHPERGPDYLRALGFQENDLPCASRFRMACLNCEPLFSFLDGLRVRIRHSFWMSEQSIEVNTCDMGEDMGHTLTEVKIILPMSHNILTSTEEDIQ
jgi:hypothetical protein